VFVLQICVYNSVTAKQIYPRVQIKGTKLNRPTTTSADTLKCAYDGHFTIQT